MYKAQNTKKFEKRKYGYSDETTSMIDERMNDHKVGVSRYLKH